MHANAIQAARQPAAVAARTLWLLRWMLVLVLVWDQVSSPLHQHRHDSVDAQWLSAFAHDAQGSAAHLEDDGHDLGASHAVLAVRPQLDLSSLTLGDDPDHGFAPSRASALPGSGPSEADAAGMAALARPHSTHRSLPPAGRAPPLHT